MRHILSIAFTFISLFSYSQYTYFDVYRPYLEWIQASGGNVQLELNNDQIKIACSPNNGNGYGFGLLDLNHNVEVVSSRFYETGGLSGNALSDGYKLFSSGHSIYCGDREDNQWVVKFGANDSIEWEYFFPYTFSVDEAFTEVLSTPSGYVFPGFMYMNNGETNNSMFLFNVSEAGDSLGMHYFDPQLTEFNLVDGTVLLEDESFLISVADNPGGKRALLKVDQDGTFNDVPENYFFYNEESVFQNSNQLILSDNGNAVVAYTTGDEQTWGGTINSVNHRFSILEFDGGNMDSIQQITYPEMHFEHFISDFLQTPDGGYAILGIDYGTFPVRSFIKKLSADFEEEWMKYYEHGGSSENLLSLLDDFEITEDGGFICAGITAGLNSSENPSNLWLLKLDACGDLEDLGCEFVDNVDELNSSLFSVYPNPASERITVNLNSTIPLNNTQAVFRNTLGQDVFATQITASEQELDVSLLPSGIYMLSLVSDGSELHSDRIVIE
ncbi:MAG: T9SS type A sorting domain-containing protein [Flavobacteriales bacterium]